MLAFFAVETIIQPIYLPYKRYIEVIIHHLLSSSLQLLVLYLGGHLFSLGFLTYVTEASSIFLNFKSIMDLFQVNKNSAIYVANALIFAFTFMCCRVGLISYIVFTKGMFSMPGFSTHFTTQDMTQIMITVLRVVQLLYFAFFFLNLYWAVLITRNVLIGAGIIKKKRKPEEQKKKN